MVSYIVCVTQSLNPRALGHYITYIHIFLPTGFEPVTMSIQLEYIGGLTLDLTLGVGHPYAMRLGFGERIIR